MPAMPAQEPVMIEILAPQEVRSHKCQDFAQELYAAEAVPGVLGATGLTASVRLCTAQPCVAMCHTVTQWVQVVQSVPHLKFKVRVPTYQLVPTYSVLEMRLNECAANYYGQVAHMIICEGNGWMGRIMLPRRQWLMMHLDKAG